MYIKIIHKFIGRQILTIEDIFLNLGFGIGVRLANMDQSLEANYDGDVGGDCTAGVGCQYKLEENFQGAVPRVMTEAGWEMGYGIPLFGNLGASLLMGGIDLTVDRSDFNSNIFDFFYL